MWGGFVNPGDIKGETKDEEMKRERRDEGETREGGKSMDG